MTLVLYFAIADSRAARAGGSSGDEESDDEQRRVILLIVGAGLPAHPIGLPLLPTHSAHMTTGRSYMQERHEYGKCNWAPALPKFRQVWEPGDQHKEYVIGPYPGPDRTNVPCILTCPQQGCRCGIAGVTVTQCIREILGDWVSRDTGQLNWEIIRMWGTVLIRPPLMLTRKHDNAPCTYRASASHSNMAVQEPEKTKDASTPKSLASRRATWQTKLRLEKGKIRQALTARLNTRLRGRFKGVPRSAQRAWQSSETTQSRRKFAEWASATVPADLSNNATKIREGTGSPHHTPKPTPPTTSGNTATFTPVRPRGKQKARPKYYAGSDQVCTAAGRRQQSRWWELKAAYTKLSVTWNGLRSM